MHRLQEHRYVVLTVTCTIEVLPTPLSPSTTILNAQITKHQRPVQPNQPDVVNGDMLVHPGRGDPREEEGGRLFFALNSAPLVTKG